MAETWQCLQQAVAMFDLQDRSTWKACIAAIEHDAPLQPLVRLIETMITSMPEFDLGDVGETILDAVCTSSYTANFVAKAIVFPLSHTDATNAVVWDLMSVMDPHTIRCSIERVLHKCLVECDPQIVMGISKIWL